MKKIILLISLFIIFPCGVLAKNPYQKYHNITGTQMINCTWSAWEYAKKLGGVELPGWGNANTWYNSAKKAGFSVGQTPKANSIMVLEWTTYGHVVYVEKVIDGVPYYWDTYDCFHETPEYIQCLEAGQSQKEQEQCIDLAEFGICSDRYDLNDLIGYIYLDSAPKTTTKKTTTKTTTTAKKTTTSATTTTISTTTLKNDVPLLASLDIEGLSISFAPETFTYTLQVPYTKAKINVQATAMDEQTKVIGTGDYDLVVGSNAINIVAMNPAGVSTTYNILITREEEITSKVITSRVTESSLKEKTSFSIYSWGRNIGFIIAFGILLILLLKQWHKRR